MATSNIFLQLSLPAGGGGSLSQSGITGESQDTNHTGWIELDSFSFGVDNATTIGSASGGAGAGKVKFSQLSIQKVVDSTSPALFSMAASGVHMPTLTLAIRKPGTNAKDFLVYTFKLVFVTDISWGGSSGGDIPSESVAFAYGALQISYAKQDASGAVGTPIASSWSQVTNQPNLTVATS